MLKLRHSCKCIFGFNFERGQSNYEDLKLFLVVCLKFVIKINFVLKIDFNVKVSICSFCLLNLLFNSLFSEVSKHIMVLSV